MIAFEKARHARDRRFDHSRLWLAAPPDRACRRRHRRACDGAVQLFPRARDPDDRCRLAHRRLRGDAPNAAGRRFRLGLPVCGVACLWRRLVVGLWLFPGGALVARRGVSRRGGRIRLGLAAGRCRASRRARDFSGSRLRACAAVVDAWRWPSVCACRRIEFCGMAARACLDRISLEHIRHGAWRQSRDRATGLARRPLWSDRHRHPYFFSSRGSWRKIRNARGKAPVAAGNRRRCSWPSAGFAHLAPCVWRRQLRSRSRA